MLDPQGEAPGEEEGSGSRGLIEILRPPRLSLQATAALCGACAELEEEENEGNCDCRL